MDIEWEISPTYEAKSVTQLTRLFYKLHTYTERGKKIGAQPLTFLQNPPQFVMPDDPFAQDMHVAIYHSLRGKPRTRYYVCVEQNIHKVMIGPHVAKLCLQIYGGKPGVYPAKIIHLGTIQIEGNFFDTKLINVALRRAIRRKEYYASPKSQEEIIEFNEPTPAVTLL